MSGPLHLLFMLLLEVFLNMPRFPGKGSRIGGGREGDAFLAGDKVTKRFKRDDPATTYLAKARFYAHEVGRLLFPQHVLKLNYAGVVGRRVGVFTTSEFQPTTPVPVRYEHLVGTTMSKLESAGILCDPGSPSNTNHGWKDNAVFFFEVNGVDEAKLTRYLQRNPQAEEQRTRVLRALEGFKRNWRQHCQQTARDAEANR